MTQRFWQFDLRKYYGIEEKEENTFEKMKIIENLIGVNL